jgi:hypothetical protein
MFKRMMLVSVMLVALSMGTIPATAQDGDQVTCEDTEGEELEDAKLYIEYNFADGDLGVHGLFDGEGWTELCVYAPDGTQILSVGPQGQLGDLGISGIFFESREPELDDFDFDALQANFPEGEYEVRGTRYDGTALSGTATFTHTVPAAPVIVSPAVTEDDEEAEEFAVSTENLVVEWEPVTETVDGNPVEITGYEVIITMEDYEDPNGLSRPNFDVHVPADRNSLTVSPEFLESSTLYEIEILALEASGNQTIGLGFFVTE